MEEKLGYPRGTTYEDWLKINHFQDLADLNALWEKESTLLAQADALSLETIAMQRINAINTILKQYE